jgi:hypothetical protein
MGENAVESEEAENAWYPLTLLILASLLLVVPREV